MLGPGVSQVVVEGGREILWGRFVDSSSISSRIFSIREFSLLTEYRGQKVACIQGLRFVREFRDNLATQRDRIVERFSLEIDSGQRKACGNDFVNPLVFLGEVLQ